MSELFVIIIDGIQDGQKTLDRFYADYDVVFPKRSQYVSKFGQVVASLKTIAVFLATSRFKKKADFYGLFAAVSRLLGRPKHSVDLKHAVTPLEQLAEQLEKPVDEMNAQAASYYGTVIEGPNKRSKRDERARILELILTGSGVGDAP